MISPTRVADGGAPARDSFMTLVDISNEMSRLQALAQDTLVVAHSTDATLQGAPMSEAICKGPPVVEQVGVLPMLTTQMRAMRATLEALRECVGSVHLLATKDSDAPPQAVR